MNRFLSMRHILGPLVLRLLALSILLLSLVLVYLSAYGFPGWLVEELVQRVELANFSMEAATARFDILNGVTLGDVRLYRKGIVGVPFMSAERATISFDPLSLLDASSLPVRSVRLEYPELRLSQLAGPEWEARGTPVRSAAIDVELEHLHVYDMDLDHIAGELIVDADGARFNRMSGTYGAGLMKGDLGGALSYDRRSREIRGSIGLTGDPSALLPLIEARNMKYTGVLVKRFTFPEQRPRFEVDFRKQLGKEYPLYLEASLWMKRFTYRGVQLLGADGRVELFLSRHVRTVDVNQLLLVRPEGIVKGGFSVDTLEREVRFDATSTIEPGALFQLIGIFQGGAMDSWKFNGPVRAAADGVVDLDAPHLLRMDSTVNGRRIGIGKLIADSCSFDMHMANATNTVSNIRGVLHEGPFTGEGIFIVPARPDTNVAYRVQCELQNANFESMCLTLGEQQKVDYKGRLTLSGYLEGLLGKRNLGTTSGEGVVGIRDGRVFMLPVFGGLSRFLTRLIPGLDFVLSQSQADADFTVEDGVIRSDNAKVEGNVLSLSGNGTYCLTDNALDFKVMLKLLKAKTLTGKVARFVLFPLSKLFEFRLKGTRTDPYWYPVNFSTDLLEKIGWKRGERENGAETGEKPELDDTTTDLETTDELME